MKKIFVLLLCVLLVCVLAVPALAAGSAHMSVSASANQLYRGDTVTFTVSISSMENFKAAGITVSYDNSVFEWVGGSVLVDGASMSNFSNGTGSFAFSEGRSISGSIFSFRLRVKDTAPLKPDGNSVTVSGSPSVRDVEGAVSSSISGATVTVLCKHEYGTPVKADDTNHVSKCVHCGGEKTEAHTWKDVKINQAATCKDEGSKDVECTACGHTATQVIPVSNDHKYSSWQKVNSSTHTHTCSVCQKVETVSHTWNSGKVTQEATCTQTGSMIRTCTGCGATKDEVVPVADHSYTQFQRVDAETHTHTCTVCQHVETLPHSYSDIWLHDADGHYRSCDGCGEKKDYSAHIPGAAATDTTPQTCTVCQRMLMPALNHAHVFETTWSVDEEAHWHSCMSCIITDSWQEHSYVNECAAACSVCGQGRQAPHVPESTWSADETGHWYACTLCGEKVGFAEHVPGPEATTTSAQICTVCQYEVTPVLPHDPVYDQGTTLHWHECICGERVEMDVDDCQICKEAGINQKFPWWIVCIAEAVVLGGVIVFLILRMYKMRKDEMYRKWKDD